MKPSNLSKDIIKRFILTITASAAVILALAETPRAQAKPRSPLPPLPEAGVLWQWRCDEAGQWFPLRGAPLEAANLSFAESWSGYALRMSSLTPALLRFPVVDTDGRTNLNCQTGSVRFWFKPDWSSQSLGGKGPGSWARLIEVGAFTDDARFGWWSLHLSPEGDTIHFRAQSGGKTVEFLRADVAWEQGQWHEIALAYDSQGSMLYIDGTPLAKGAGVNAKLGAKAQDSFGFAIGGDMAGANLAQGEFDEFVTYNHPLSPREVLWIYQVKARQAALGAISEEEELTQLLRLESVRSGEMTLMSSPPPPPGGGGGGSTNEPPPSIPAYSGSLLHLKVPLLTNGTWFVGVGGNDAGKALYNLQQITNLNTGYSWVTVQQATQGQSSFMVATSSVAETYFQLAIPQQLLVPGPQTFAEDTELKITGITILGFETNSGQLQMSLAVTNGSLKLEVVSGISFVSGTNGLASMTIAGTSGALNNAVYGMKYLGHTNFFGADTLSVALSQQATQIVAKTVGLTVTNVNDPPVLLLDVLHYEGEGEVSLPSPGLLTNIFDVDGDAVYAVPQSLTSGQRTFTLNQWGGFVFRLSGSGCGGLEQNISYQVQDSHGAVSAYGTLDLVCYAPCPAAPSIAIVYPTTGALFLLGAPVPLTNSMTVNGCVSILSVQYFSGTNVIGTVTTPPYNLIWTNALLGSNDISAVITAFGCDYLMATSQVVRVFIDNDSDGDGIADSLESVTNRYDFYNGVLPSVVIAGGDYQSAAAGTTLPTALQVQVTRGGTNLPNAPIAFAVTDGGGLLSLAGSAPWQTNLTSRANGSGSASMRFQLPTLTNNISHISATAQTQGQVSQVAFTAIATNQASTNVSAYLQVYTPLR